MAEPSISCSMEEMHLTPQPTHPPHGRKIICAVDDSPHSMHAFEWTLSHVVQKGDLVITATVVEPTTECQVLGDTIINVPVAESEEEWATIKAIGAKVLEKFRSSAARSGVMSSDHHPSSIKFEALRGVSAARALAAFAEAETADLLIVGSRGLGAFKRGLLTLFGMGSESGWLVNNAKVPVLVIPPTGKMVEDRGDTPATGHAHATEPPAVAAVPEPATKEGLGEAAEARLRTDPSPDDGPDLMSTLGMQEIPPATEKGGAVESHESAEGLHHRRVGEEGTAVKDVTGEAA